MVRLRARQAEGPSCLGGPATSSFTDLIPQRHFQGSTLRAADLSSADFSGTDLTSADLTGANLDAGGNVISLTPDASAHRFLCLTEDCDLGRISVQADGSLKLSVIQPGTRAPALPPVFRRCGRRMNASAGLCTGR